MSVEFLTEIFLSSSAYFGYVTIRLSYAESSLLWHDYHIALATAAYRKSDATKTTR